MNNLKIFNPFHTMVLTQICAKHWFLWFHNGFNTNLCLTVNIEWIEFALNLKTYIFDFLKLLSFNLLTFFWIHIKFITFHLNPFNLQMETERKPNDKNRQTNLSNYELFRYDNLFNLVYNNLHFVRLNLKGTKKSVSKQQPTKSKFLLWLFTLHAF